MTELKQTHKPDHKPALDRAAKAANAQRYRLVNGRFVPDPRHGTHWVLGRLLESIAVDADMSTEFGRTMHQVRREFQQRCEAAMRELKAAGHGEGVWLLTPEGPKLTYGGR